MTDDIWAIFGGGFFLRMVGKEGVLDAVFTTAYGHLRRNFRI